MYIFLCMDSKFLNPYTAKYAFYGLLFLYVNYNIFELWRNKL